MSIKGKIKVIKRGELESKKRSEPPKPKKRREAVRKMAENVSSWVTEFQGRKSDGAKLAFESLFTSRPRPSES